MDHDMEMPAEREMTVPLFPLPNVVLLPRAVLPLHIFEERYKTMTAQALAGDRRIAMCLLKPGWEKSYYDRPPIEQAVCVGRILSAEKLPDGKYNFLLQGESRCKIVREISHSPYRVAEIEPIEESSILEIDLSNERQRLSGMFSSGGLADTPLGRQLRQILSSALATSDAADMIAFNLLEDVALKQSLLADGDIIRRVNRLIAALDRTLPVLEVLSHLDTSSASLN